MELPSYIVADQLIDVIVSKGLCSSDQKTSLTSLELLHDLPLNMQFLKQLSQMEPIKSNGEQFIADWCKALGTPGLNERQAYLGLKHMMGMLLIKDIKKTDDIYLQRKEYKRQFVATFKESNWQEFIEQAMKIMTIDTVESM